MLDLIRRHEGPAEAIVDCASGDRLSYQSLLARVDAIGKNLSRIQERALVFLYAGNNADFVALYLGCLQAALPVFLVDPKSPTEFLLEVYRPSLILAPAALSSKEPTAVTRADQQKARTTMTRWGGRNLLRVQ